MITLVVLAVMAGCGKDNKIDSDSTEITHTLTGEVSDITDTAVYMTVLESKDVLESEDEIFFGITEELLESNDFVPQVGDTISITIKDQIAESYPAEVWVVSWSPVPLDDINSGIEDK